MRHNLDTSPRRYTSPTRIAAFLDMLRWAGVTLTDDGSRYTVQGDKTGMLQAEVDKRVMGIREAMTHANS